MFFLPWAASQKMKVSMMDSRERLTSLFSTNNVILFCIAFVGFVIHVAFASNYGFLRDELYYIVSGQHLSFGYVDFPPLIPAIAAYLGFHCV